MTFPLIYGKIPYMEVTRDNLLSLIQTGLKHEGLSIAGLERQAGVPKDTIRDFLRGKTQILRADKLQKILRVLEPSQNVTIIGYVGAEGEIFSSDTNEHVDCPPGFEPQEVHAVRIQGDAMSPVFHDGWIVYYSFKNSSKIPVIQGGWQVPYAPLGKNTAAASDTAPSITELIGKPCVIKLSDGRLMLRTLKQGSKPNLYNLIAYNADAIKDVEIRSAAKIIFIKPN